MRLKKTYELASFKALPGENGNAGRFTAIVSVFGNVDLQGDRVMKGAFTKSIEKWRKSGDPIPIIWSHDWGDPFAYIGEADPQLIKETDVGLELTGDVDMHKPFAAQVFDLLRSKRVREWSFAYDVLDEAKAEDKANNLITLDIIEAGPTLKGANPDTETLGVKAMLETAAHAGAKAGRVLNSKNEASLRQAYELIGTVLSSLDKEEVKTDSADGAKSPPWHVEERAGEYCVIVNETGETVKCHPTQQEANAHVQALYANVPDAGKADEPDGEKVDDIDAAANGTSKLHQVNAKILALTADL